MMAEEEKNGAPEQENASEMTEEGRGNEDLAARIEQLQAEVESLSQARLRALADAENVRRRTRDELEQTRKYASEEVLRGLLPIIDDFERSIESGRESQDFEKFFEGISMIHRKLVKTLSELGLERIEAVGQEFDVDLHEAMMKQPSEDEEGIILAELEPGYRYKDKVLRHAKVIVSSGE